MTKSVAIITLLIVFISCFIAYFNNKPYNELLEIESCPFCFGTSFCETFFRDKISIKKSVTLLKAITFILNLLGINNVIFASLDDEDIVIKKLAHKWEFRELDDKMAENNFYELNTESHIIKKMKQYLNTPFGSTVINNIRLCPTIDKFDSLYKSLRMDDYNDPHFKDSYINMWFTLNVNPEPFIQKILPQEDGWPVPKYLGSCGRTIVSEYCGDMLTDHVQDTWIFRSNLAYQLLGAAFNFTYNHPIFAFYLTDITPDNIAIMPNSKLCFVDLENIIIVERNTTADFVPNWNEIHSCDDMKCENCFAFSSDDICSHSISDHNIYAVCREILNPHSYLIDGGLLHTPPEIFLKQNPHFWTIILDCIQPPKDRNRFFYAKKLMKILK